MLRQNRNRVSISVALLFVCAAFIFATLSAWAQRKPAIPSAEVSSEQQAEAKRTYDTVCAACHGLDAHGSERGPNIASRPDVVRKTDAELAQIVSNGKPAAGMPPFSSLGAAQISAMVDYLRTLQGRGKNLTLPGNPEKGKALFFGTAKCSQCHAVEGQGGFFASDLAAYGGKLDAGDLRARILNPDAGIDPRRGMVHAVLSDGTEVTGAVRNENNFSIQLQTPDGTFHLLPKSGLRSQTYIGASGMPRDYDATLSPAELNDVISFLLRAISETTRQSAPKPGLPDDN